MAKLDILFDMETSDPDDVLTLCYLVNHSRVNLRAVTVMPGTDEQVGLVKHVLRIAGLDIPVGSYHPGYDKNVVSSFYYKWFLDLYPKKPDEIGFHLITRMAHQYPNLTVLTGAPLKNFSAIADDLELERWVAQGGFAGDNIVPPDLRLEKFDGLLTCPTFNFNGAPKTALALLASPKIKTKYLVSKNVCHGVVYDQAMHEQFAPYRKNSPGLEMAYHGMTKYLNKTPMGKKFHDPLAMAVALEPEVCRFAEVELYRRGGKWGSKLKPGSNTFISISADVPAMVRVLNDQ